MLLADSPAIIIGKRGFLSMIFEQYHDYINYYKGLFSQLATFKETTTWLEFRYLQRKANRRSRKDYKQLMRYEKLIKKQIFRKAKELQDRGVYSLAVSEKLLLDSFKVQIKRLKVEEKIQNKKLDELTEELKRTNGLVCKKSKTRRKKPVKDDNRTK